MPNDTYGGLYINKELVKGSWYGVCSGPKPQVFTGNINNTGDLENIRNKSLYISSASSSNGTFPEGTYGHNFAVLTIRYGEGNGLYIQKAVDLSVNPVLEYERAWNNNDWTTWIRVTSFGDASQAAATAQSTADDAKRRTEYLYKITGYSDGTTSANPTIDSRIRTNRDNIDTINKTLGSTPSGQTINGRINSINGQVGSLQTNVSDLQTKAGKLLNQSDTQRLINIHMGCSVIDVPSGDSSLFPYWNNETLSRNWASDRGCTSENSVMFASTGYVFSGEKQGTGHGAHIEGMQFSNRTGCWYITFDSSTIPPERIYGLYVNWILFVNNGNWN